MITEEQIIKAVTECGISYYRDDLVTIFNRDELTKFAQHLYRQGLLDGAEKCYELDIESFGVMPVRVMQITRACNQAIQQMADEVGK